MSNHIIRACLGLALIAAACSESPSAPSGATGRLTVRLTDTPFTEARAVLVTFSSVRAHRTGEDWTDVPFADGATSRTCDLKKLQGPQDVLGTGPLPAGRYTMVRLVVSGAALYFDNAAAGPACAPAVVAPAGRTATLEIPSGEVRLNRGFDLAADGATTMLLDFDGDRSIRETGNGRYLMTPVISVVSVQ